jgi:hypothetical protein
MQVLATLPEVTITKKGWKKGMSIYILSLASDLSGNAKNDPNALKDLGLDITDGNIINATKYVNLSVSPPFENVTPDQPLPIIGDGIILYPPADPQGALSVYFAIAQSKAARREFGALLGQVFSDPNVQDGISKIEQAWQTVGKLSSTIVFGLIGDAGKVVGNVLSQTNDKILFSSLFSGLEIDNYDGSPDGKGYTVGNDYASAVLKVWAQADS